ncbi:MAG: hypothetical protein L3K02_08145, partial [Thermoplasmata archaeon]|nr:hypothetical protein [Thermoplasmata archaeon]
MPEVARATPATPPLAPGLRVPAATLLTTVNVSVRPTTVTIDPTTDDLYVTDFGPVYNTNDAVTVFAGSNDTPLRTFMVGDDPVYSTYDSADGYVYVMDYGTTYYGVQVTASTNLTVVSGTAVLTTLTVGAHPRGAAYDPGNQYVYVANSGSANVSVVSGTRVIGVVSVGANPNIAVYDKGNGYI